MIIDDDFQSQMTVHQPYSEDTEIQKLQKRRTQKSGEKYFKYESERKQQGDKNHVLLNWYVDISLIRYEMLESRWNAFQYHKRYRGMVFQIQS